MASCSCWHTYCCQRPGWLQLILGPGKHCGNASNGCQMAKGTTAARRNGTISTPTPKPPRKKPGPRPGTGSAMGGRVRKDVRQKRKKKRNGQ